MKTFLFLLVASSSLMGQVSTLPADSRSISRAQCFSSLTGPWSLYSNMAGTDFPKGNFLSAGLTYYPSFPGVSSIMAAIARRVLGGFGAFVLHRTGNELFSYQSLGVQFSHGIGNTNLGGRIKWIQVGFEGGMRLHIPSADIGVITKITERFRIGAFAGNITRSPMSDRVMETQPLLLSVGLFYIPADEVEISVEQSVREVGPTSTGISLTYKPSDVIELSAGAGGPPVRLYFGLALHLKDLHILYGGSFQQVIGTVQSWSVGTSF